MKSNSRVFGGVVLAFESRSRERERGVSELVQTSFHILGRSISSPRARGDCFILPLSLLPLVLVDSAFLPFHRVVLVGRARVRITSTRRQRRQPQRFARNRFRILDRVRESLMRQRHGGPRDTGEEQGCSLFGGVPEVVGRVERGIDDTAVGVDCYGRRDAARVQVGEFGR